MLAKGDRVMVIRLYGYTLDTEIGTVEIVGVGGDRFNTVWANFDGETRTFDNRHLLQLPLPKEDA